MRDLFKDFPKTKCLVTKQNGHTFEIDVIEGTKGKMLTVDYDKVKPNNIEENDIIKLFYRDGTASEYIVIEPGFYEQFIDMPAHYQIRIEKLSSNNERQNNGMSINNNGGNVILNNNSPHSNISITQKDFKFDEIKRIISESIEIKNKELLLELLEEMKNVKNNPETFAQKYNAFISGIANHVTIISPFLPFLASFL